MLSFPTCIFFFFSSPSEVFCDSQKNILKENDIVRFPKLADTYQRIADEGPDVFYNGSMAQSIVEDVQAAGSSLILLNLVSLFFSPHTPSGTSVQGGIITLDDLLEYQPVLNETPLKLNVGEYTMHVPDAPSSGPVLALILNIVEGEQPGQVCVQPCGGNPGTSLECVCMFLFVDAGNSSCSLVLARFGSPSSVRAMTL